MNRFYFFISVMLVLGCIQTNATVLEGRVCSTIQSNDTKHTPAACTVFTFSKGEQVFFGGNNDYVNLDSYYWVDPGNDQRYGAIWIGFPDNVQQGINEKGLAYDSNGLPRVDVNPHLERTPVLGSYTSYPIQILHQCATVQEVINWVNSHQWHSFMHDQMHFADITGDAVIISVGKEDEIVFTHKPPGDGFLVSTNFNVANPANGFGYPCWRYDRATELLREMVNKQELLTARDVAKVLDAVHVEGGSSWTLASLLTDLTHGLVYLYYFYQFDRPVVLDIKEELANPRNPGPLSQLFPQDVQQEATYRYEKILEKAQNCQKIGLIWLVLLFISLISMIGFSIHRRKINVFWILATICLGPLALIDRIIVEIRQIKNIWIIILLETIGDVIPAMIAYILFLVIIIFIPSAQTSWLPQLFLILIFPVLLACFLFHGLPLSSITKMNYGLFLKQRFPHCLVVTNLGMGGMSIVAFPLFFQSINTCSVLPFNVWILLTWWAIAVLGALSASLTIFFYEYWSIRAGLRAWSVLVRNMGYFYTPSWRKLGLWILFSYVVLLGGMVMGVILRNVYLS